MLNPFSRLNFAFFQITVYNERMRTHYNTTFFNAYITLPLDEYSVAISTCVFQMETPFYNYLVHFSGTFYVTRSQNILTVVIIINNILIQCKLLIVWSSPSDWNRKGLYLRTFVTIYALPIHVRTKSRIILYSHNVEAITTNENDQLSNYTIFMRDLEI